MQLINKLFLNMAIVCSILSGCRAPQVLSTIHTDQRVFSSVKDSISVKDTLFKVAASTAKVIVSVKKDSNNTIVIHDTIVKNGISSISIKTIHDSLYFEANCDSATYWFKSYQAEHWRVDSLSKGDSSSKIVETRVPYVPKIYKILAAIGVLSVTYWGFKAYNKIKPI